MTLASILFPERDCATCQQQVEWGCETPPWFPVVLDEEEGPLERCPKRPVLEDPARYTEIFAIWQWRERGFLPEPGTWKDQPAKLVTLLQIMDHAMQEANAELEKREKRKQALDRSRAGGSVARPHVG